MSKPQLHPWHQAVSGRMQGRIAASNMLNRWILYEQKKNDLPKDLSPEQYEAEIRRIADEVGV